MPAWDLGFGRNDSGDWTDHQPHAQCVMAYPVVVRFTEERFLQFVSRKRRESPQNGRNRR